MATAKPATVKKYLTALCSLHLESGLPTSVFGDPLIDLIIRGGKWIYGDGTKRLRLPLMAPILVRMVDRLRLDEEDINIKSALCMAFATFL